VKKLKKLVKKHKLTNDIKFWGKVSSTFKNELLQKAHILLIASILEGWGLVVTEANSQGTVAIGYNVGGIRDSIKNGKTGLLTEKNNPLELAKKIIVLFEDQELYGKLRLDAWEDSKYFNWDRTTEELCEGIWG